MVLVSKVSATIYYNFLSKVHFFFDKASAKKKFPKRNAVSFACAAGATPRGATAFKKAVQNDSLVCANKILILTAKNPSFLKKRGCFFYSFSQRTGVPFSS